MSNIIELNKVSKIFTLASQSVTALSDINLEVKTAQIVSITGRSGSGKSTLLHLIGLLDFPTEGDIRINGSKTSELPDILASRLRNESVGFIFQMNNLLPEFTAYENIIMPFLISGGSETEVKDRALNLLHSVGMENRIKHRPGELSGGEQQRVAIARALVMNPPIVLADEPTGNLDKSNSDKIMNLLFKLCEDFELTLLIVTHDRNIADATPSQIRMEDGKIVEVGGAW